MRRFLRVIPVAVAIALVAPALGSSIASAQTVDGQRQKVEDIVDKLERLEEQAIQIGEQYVDVIDTKARLDGEIVEAAARVADKEAELAELQGSLGEMAVRSFVGGGAAPLGPLFEDASNLNDVLQRDQLARIALSAGDVTVDELDALVVDLQREREDLADKLDQASQLADSLVVAKQETDSLTSEYQQARAEAESELGELIAEEEARRAAESARQVQQQVSRATASAGTGSGGSTNGGAAPAAAAPGAPESGDASGTAAAPPSAPAPAASSLAGAAISAALGQVGVPYKYATSDPGVSFDCSGLTSYAWAQGGVSLPRQSQLQYNMLPHVSQGDAQPGDLLFYYSPISHVGIYLGGGQLVHAPNTGTDVKVSAVNWGNVTGVGRPG